MKKEPHVKTFLDDEEQDLIKAIEADDYRPGPSQLTPEALQSLQKAARNTISEASTKVSLRIAKTDLARIKARALREGIPYQTLIKSIIHQAVTR